MKVPKFPSPIVEEVYKAIKQNRKAKYSWLQDNLGVSESTILRAIADLKYMRRFCEIWPDEEIVQRSVAQLPWRHNICLMEKVKEPNRRLAYAMASIKYGWSRTILELQLENYTIERTGKLPTNFDKTLPDIELLSFY